MRLMRDTDVTGIAVDARGVTGVETSRGFISGRTVVNAAGAWAGNVARLAGVDLPVEPLRRMLVPTEPFDKVSHQSPMVVDMTTGFHYRPEGRGLLLAWNDPEETPGFKLNFDRGFIEKILTRGVDRLPCLEEAEVNPKRAWAGLYEMTPDHHPVMGPVKEVPGLVPGQRIQRPRRDALPRHRPHPGGPDPATAIAIWWIPLCWASTVSPPAACFTKPPSCRAGGSNS